MTPKLWTGGAAGVAQRDLITIGGTWLAAETVTVAIGGSNLVVTVGTSTTTASVAEALAAAINATSRTSGLILDESRNVGGQQIAEFTEVAATSSGSVVTLEANALGVPFTLSASEGSASGTISPTTSVAATGPNFFDNAENWQGAIMPVSGDKIVFQNNSVDCLYGLSQVAITNVTLQIDSTYTGRIGLKPYNDRGYDEYRQRHLLLVFASDERSIVIGEGPGAGSPRINIDVSTSNPKAVVLNTGAGESGAKAAVDFKGGNTAFDLSVRRGSVSIAGDANNAATLRELEISYETQQNSDARVYMGSETVISIIHKTGGQLVVMNTASAGSISTVTHEAGYAEFNGQTGVIAMKLYGGETRWHSTGTLGTLSMAGAAVFDVSRDLRPKIITNPIERYSDGSRIIDPHQVIANLRIDNNFVSDLSGLVIGTDFRITRAATA